MWLDYLLIKYFSITDVSEYCLKEEIVINIATISSYHIS